MAPEGQARRSLHHCEMAQPRLRSVKCGKYEVHMANEHAVSASNASSQVSEPHAPQIDLSHYARRPDQITARLAELDREWDIERILEANAAGASLVGIVLGTT